MEEPIFTILSSDMRLFTIEDWLIRKSECFTVFSAQVFARNLRNPLQTNVHSLILEKIFEWCAHHRHDIPNMQFRIIPHWDTHFLRVNNNIVFNLIEAAFRLGIEEFLDIACRGVANTLGRTVNEVRTMLRVGGYERHEPEEFELDLELDSEEDWEEEADDEAVPAA